MKNCIVYLSTNPTTKERISCGLIYIKDDGSHIFKWSEKKLNLYLSIMDNNKEGIKSIIDMTFYGIENYRKGKIESVIKEAQKSNAGIIYYGDIIPFIIPSNHFKNDENEFDFWFEKMINNSDPRETKLNDLGI